MVKYYILDTNVLLYDPQSLFAFDDNIIIIPIDVLEEIDGLKKKQDEIGKNAREVSRLLDNLKTQCSFNLPNEGKIFINLNKYDTSILPFKLDNTKTDNHILALAYSLKQNQDKPVVLVTKDLNLRIKAYALGIKAEDYLNKTVNYINLYTGVSQVYSNKIDNFFSVNELDEFCCEEQLFPNQFIIIKGIYENKSALGRFINNKIVKLKHENTKMFGLSPKNKEQKFAFELLLDDDIKVVSLVGKAGTGKTLLAIAGALQKVLEEKKYKKILITRPIIPFGNDIGFLPGTKEEKLHNWMQPIYDNLSYLFSDTNINIIKELLEQEILEIEALTYIRGRSISNQFIICDEAQNLSPNMIKTIITRVSENSKIVFTGDPEQIDNSYLDASSNGLSYLVEKLKFSEITGHITLTKGERSKVAELGSYL